MTAGSETGGGWRVRVGVAADVDAVLKVERAVSEAPHWSREEYVGIFRDPSEAGAGAVHRGLLVAENGSGLLGFAVGAVLGFRGVDWGSGLEESGSGEVQLERLEGEIESIAVVGSARRSGIGHALCRGVLRWCEAQGADAVELEVRSANVSAIGLYRGMGFQEIGVRLRYYHDPADDALLMRVLLPSGGP